MMWVVSVIGVYCLARLGCTQSSCRGNAENRIMECSQLLQGFGQALTPLDRRKHCGDAIRSLHCIRQVVQECQGIEGTPLEEMLDSFNQMEEYLNGICSAPLPATNAPVANTVNACSRRDQRKLKKCSHKMQRYAAESPMRCSKIRRTFDCMTTMLERCSSIIEVGTLARVNSLRENLMEMCVETKEPVDEVDEDNDANNGNEVHEITECPDDYVKMLQNCLGDLNVEVNYRMEGSIPSPKLCQEIKRNIDCTSNIVSACAYQPEVVSVSAYYSEGELRDYFGEVCPETGRNPGTEIEGTMKPPNTCGISDPAGKLQRCNTFLSSFQLSEGELQTRCRTLYEGFDCFRDLISRCPEDPVVAAFMSMIDIEDARQSMSAYCEY